MKRSGIRPIRRNDLVKIGKGTRVYRVHVCRGVDDDQGNQRFYYLEADADHPNAGKRLPDAFRWYATDELTRVG